MTSSRLKRKLQRNTLSDRNRGRLMLDSAPITTIIDVVM